jgi:hypothetical protein
MLHLFSAHRLLSAALSLAMTISLVGCPGMGSLTANQASLPPQPPQPAIDAISPGTVVAGSSSPLQIVVFGENFTSDARVLWFHSVGTDNDQVTTTFVSSTELIATIPADYLTVPSMAPVTVSEGPPVNTETFPVNFFTMSSNPRSDPALVPVITQILPASEVAGLLPTYVQVYGTNLTSTATIEINGMGRASVRPASNVVSTEQVMMRSDVATPGTLEIKVINDPNVAPSKSAYLTVTGPM